MTDYTYLSSQIKIDIWLSGYKLGLSIIQVGTYAICCKDCDCYQHVYNCLKCLLEWFSKIFWWQTGEQNWLLNSTVCMCAQHYKYCLMPWLETICLQGHWKQSADGQVQFNVGGKDVNNLCAIWTYLFLAVGGRSHCTSASNWELPLLCSPALQETSSLIKSWGNTYDFLQHLFLHCIAMCYTIGWKDLRATFFWPNILFGKENDTGWWGSPGRSGV